jgi:putative FmdB family regulatory protein
MPIYAYRCERCGHAKDVIQKFSDAPLSVCPECGAEAFRKQLTAPAFQLKGSGWYVTDFRDNGAKAKPAKPGEPESGGAAPSQAPEAKPAATGAADGGSSGGTTAAAAPAAAPAPAASSPDKTST